MVKQLELFEEHDILTESKDILSKIVAGYAAKEAKKDWLETWYANAKEHYIRKASKIKERIKQLEDTEEYKNFKQMELINAEASRRASEKPQEESALVNTSDVSNPPEGPVICKTEGPDKGVVLAQEVGGTVSPVEGVACGIGEEAKS